MENKQFKYQEYINKYKNCPGKDFVEKDVIAFRWVHLEMTIDDFIPNVFSPKHPNRTLDSSDLTCESFALSMYKDLITSKEMYFDSYNKRNRPHLKEKFKDQKGNAVALLHLKKEDGVSDEARHNGHFSFFEYSGFDYLKRFKQLFDIFAYNDTDKDIQD